MNCVIYVKQDDDISVYEQYNVCAEYAKRYGCSVEYKVLDFDGTQFYEAINKVIAEHDITALIVYDKDMAFKDFEDYLFYHIYLRKLDKKLISCN